MAGETPAAPGRWHTREDSGLRIDREGRWFHDEVIIDHPKILEAFNRGLEVQPDGRVVLRFGNDWCFVQVDGCAFRVVAVDETDDGALSVRLSDRTAERLAPESLRLDAEGVLEVAVKGGLARARFTRDAQFQLAGYFIEGDTTLFLQVGPRTWPTPLPR